MDATRFDRIAKVFADRKLSRRWALARGGTGLAAAALAAAGLSATGPAVAAAQDATPDPTGATGDHGPTMLFVQTYQSGTIAANEGIEDRYTLTLDAGSGQTVYFSDRPDRPDRPDRVVGANPTAQFLEGLGFPADNPPNAALVVETAPGETDIAVVELFAPRYDPVSQGVTYQVEVLANWETSLEMGFSEAPTDLATLAPASGAAQLFIDDCPDATMTCYTADVHGSSYVEHGTIDNAEHNGFCYSWGQMRCLPCSPWNQWGGGTHARTGAGSATPGTPPARASARSHQFVPAASAASTEYSVPGGAPPPAPPSSSPSRARTAPDRHRSAWSTPPWTPPGWITA